MKFTKKELIVLEDCLFCEMSAAWHKENHNIKNKIWNKALEMGEIKDDK